MRAMATWAGIAGLLCLAAPARAECMGSCLDGMVAALASIVVYGVIGIVLLVMLIRQKWRRAGLRSLAVVAVLAIGVPLVSQAWQLGRAWLLDRHEIVGPLPDLSARTPLVIVAGGACQYGACGAVLWGRTGKAVYILPVEALAGLDLTGPIPLQTLPLELWALEEGDTSVASRRLAPTERARAAAKIDYLVVAGWGFYRGVPDEVQVALRRNPALADVGGAARVDLLLAPLDPLRPTLDLAAVKPDLLDLSLTSDALAIPLAPLNTTRAPDSPAAPDAVARAICPLPDGTGDPYCLNLLTR